LHVTGNSTTPQCTPQITATSSDGNVVITETGVGASYYAVQSITGAPGSSYIVGTPNLTTGSVTVALTSNLNSAAIVTYVNKLVPGYVEICKATPAGSGLTGAYSFTLSNAADSFTTTASALVGTCTSPIQVPAGPLTITEGGTNLYITGIGATFNGTGNALVSANLVSGTSVVTVRPSTDASNQTDVTYTNNVVSLKICKTFVGTLPTGVTSFPFSFAVSGAAGPAGPTSAVSIAPGTCQIVGAYRPGTQVVVTEGIVPGTKVSAIANTGALSTVANTTSTVNGTTTVLIGTSSSSTTDAAPGNEAVVTFTDIPALPGQLKICKTAATTPSPVTFSTATFTVTGVTGTISVPVTAGATNCVIVTGFRYGSSTTVTETGLSATNVVSAISVVPTFLTQENPSGSGTFVATTTPVVVGTPSLSGGTVTVLTGEDNTTEVTFTDTDPPVAPVDGGTVVSNPGSNNGITIGATSSLATTVAGGVVTAAGNATTTVSSAKVNSSVFSPTLSTSSVKKLTAAQRKALLKKDQKSLSNVKATIAKFNRLLSHTRANSAAHKADAKRLVQLKAEEHVLNIEIGLLK
jgi:hypothetical protein